MIDAKDDRTEQRRSPRVDVSREAWLDLEICATVRIVDIGGGGAMVAGLVPALPGERGMLRTALDGLPVELPFEVSWRGGAGRDARSATRAGGAFGDLAAEARHRLETFLSRVR